MKYWLLCFWVTLFSSISFGGVEMVSLYFEEDNSKPTGYTTCKMDELRQLMSTHHIQVIEINSFADIEGSVEANKKIATQRLNFVLNFFKIDGDGAQINVYGKSKVILNFRPYSWHRVDIYYFLGEEINPVSIEQKIDEIDTLQTHMDAVIPKVPEADKITENVPIVLAINFKGGTNKLQKGAQPRLEQLYNTLTTYPGLTAHIRGHVCCGNNRFISRKRAKVVYKYLKDKGLDKKRLSFKGYSNYLPLVFPERTGADRAANRRVDIIFQKNAQ